ncbi:unnamed protein product [Nezara viridula]|uniref:Uncharacterized protein n=1 Tax=Nezara viridula TaxID=85310 RepID=A0A9P0GV78_NEZVI|nr:unnamed protein product [Nezara viridula]
MGGFRMTTALVHHELRTRSTALGKSLVLTDPFIIISRHSVKWIGRYLAKKLLECDASVVALCQSENDLASLKGEVPDITTIAVDITDTEKMTSLVEGHGPYHGLVNNAAFVELQPFLEATPECIDSQVVAKSMIDNEIQGSIVNVSSQASLIALKDHAVYGGTKGALDMVSKVMALELGSQYCIRVNCVNPTIVLTERGIGRCLAKKLTECHAEVVALSRTAKHLNSLKKEVPEVTTIAADVTDTEQVTCLIEEHGPFHGLVNNAGSNFLQPFLEVTPKCFDKLFDVNVKAPILISQAVAKGMIDNKIGGSIVNVSSQASLIALHDHTVYCGSKGALDTITKVMALELGKYCIRVNYIIEVVNAIIYLLSDASSMVNGVMLRVDGGATAN